MNKKIKIFSGGQNGADRAALDAAMELGIETGVFCPKDRRAEDGRIPEHYPLTELKSTEYTDRTLKNVLESDASLICYKKQMDNGTELTAVFCEKNNKACLKVCVDRQNSIEDILDWIDQNEIRVLNIAGSRASSEEDIYEVVKPFLMKLFSELINQPKTK